MFKVIQKYMKDRLNSIVFIELKKDASIADKRFNLLKGISIPIHIKELTNPIKKGKTIEDISLATMAKGMISIIGLDSKFKYVPQYKEILHIFDEKIELYIGYKGIKLAEKKKFYDALVYFKALIELDENNINGLYNYARCCQDIARLESDEEKIKDFTQEAMHLFEKIIEIYPDFAPAYYYLGFYYVNQRLFKKAQLTWEACLESGIDENRKQEVIIQLQKIEDDVQYEEGYLLILNEQSNLGIERLKPLLKKHPDKWNLLFFIGLGYRKLGQIKKAIRYFKKVLEIRPTQADTFNELGLCYSMINEFQKAEKCFLKVLRIKGENSEILCNLGIVYMDQYKINLAREALEKSIKIDPNDELTIQCLKKLDDIS